MLGLSSRDRCHRAIIFNEHRIDVSGLCRDEPCSDFLLPVLFSHATLSLTTSRSLSSLLGAELDHALIGRHVIACHRLNEALSSQRCAGRPHVARVAPHHFDLRPTLRHKENHHERVRRLPSKGGYQVPRCVASFPLHSNWSLAGGVARPPGTEQRPDHHRPHLNLPGHLPPDEVCGWVGGVIKSVASEAFVGIVLFLCMQLSSAACRAVPIMLFLTNCSYSLLAHATLLLFLYEIRVRSGRQTRVDRSRYQNTLKLCPPSSSSGGNSNSRAGSGCSMGRARERPVG